MNLTVKHKRRLFLITLLLIHLTGCAIHQKTIPLSTGGTPSTEGTPSTTGKDEWFAKDKVKHFSASFLIGALTYSIARAGGADKDDAGIIGFSFSSSCGVSKELHDEVKRNDWSYKDLIWDFLGSSVGVSVSNVLD